MKTRLSITTIMCICALTTLSGHVSAQLSKDKDCELVSIFAGSIMEYRQSDIKITDTLKYLEDAFENENDDGFLSRLKPLVLDAYEVSSRDTKKRKDKEVSEFANQAYLSCMKS